MRYEDMLNAIKENPEQVYTRKAWIEGSDGKPRMVWYKPPVDIQIEWCHDPILRKVCELNGGQVHANGQVCHFDGEKVLSGWVADVDSQRAFDWIPVVL